MAWTTAGSRSGMDGYELHGHLSEQLFSAIVDCFANFSSSVGSVSEEIYSLQAVYFSYTSRDCAGASERKKKHHLYKELAHAPILMARKTAWGPGASVS